MGLRSLLSTGVLTCLLTAPAVAQTAVPDAPVPQAAAATPAGRQQLQMTPDEKEKLRISKLAIVNGRPYDQPSEKDKFVDYLNDSYGLPALARSGVRSLYAQSRDKPTSWGQDWPGYGQRLGSAMAVTAIGGNVRYGLGEIFHEDMRYIPCHGCKVKHKIENALLAEVTARHDENGHRFFTLTPVISDFSGPLISNTFWIPGNDPINGVIGARLIFATRIGGHLFTEFVLERRHHDKPED
jgi:hypothetical protein